jgi:hypothetical protein
MKNVFKSKTAAVALITTIAGIVGQFVPSVSEYVATNSSIILMGLGVVSFGLRLVTKGSVSLFPTNYT